MVDEKKKYARATLFFEERKIHSWGQRADNYLFCKHVVFYPPICVLERKKRACPAQPLREVLGREVCFPPICGKEISVLNLVLEDL